MTQSLLSGRVAKVNNKGFVLEGETEWYSYSQYPPASEVPRAAVGEHVTFQINDKRFIQSLVKNGAAAEPARRSVYQEAPEEGGDRQMYIIRQSALRTAAQLVAGKCLSDPELQGKTTVDQLLRLAARFEDWVRRKEDE